MEEILENFGNDQRVTIGKPIFFHVDSMNIGYIYIVSGF